MKNRIKWLNITRDKLWLMFNERGFKRGCEVGVAMGFNAESMCKSIAGLDLLLVDIYEKDKNYKASMLRRPKKIQRWAELRMKRCVKLYGCTYRFIKKPSMEAVREVEDESLDFVYIDANHRFDYVMRDIIEWSRKVRAGGIVSGHDYYRFHKKGVMRAVNAYTNAHNIFPLYITGRDKRHSYFWDKL